MTYSGGETRDLTLPLDAHPRDLRPLERVERVTLEARRAGGEHYNDRLVIHAPTLAPRT